MSERYKLCESCGSEFQSRVEACIDCGGPLVEVDLRMTTSPRPRREAPPPPPAETAERVLAAADRPLALRVEEPGYIGPLAERVRAAGIRCDVIPEGDCRSGCRIRWALWVAEADRDAAATIDRQHLASVVPDAESFVDLDAEGCPACGAARSPGAAECGECGLTLDFAPEDLEGLAEDEDAEHREKAAI